jgi:hypothetical protein
MRINDVLLEFAPDSNDSGGEDDALHKYARMWWAGDEATQMQIEKVLARMGWEIGEDEGGYDNGGVFVVRAGDENGNSYQSWPAEDLTEGLTEVDRRGFLKGLGAAAVASAIPLGAKAQSPNYSQLANYAVQKANEIVTGYSSVMTSQRRSYFANYTREEIYKQTVWYLNNTGGYNAQQVINYGLSLAKQECDSIKGGIGDFIGGAGLRDNMSMRVVNTFAQTYASAMQQKYSEYQQQAGKQQQQQQQQQKVMGNLSKEELDILLDGLTTYAILKELNFEDTPQFKDVSSAIGNVIKAYNNKDQVNSLYSELKQAISQMPTEAMKKEMARTIDPNNLLRVINSLNKLASNKKPEFESVEQGMAEGEVTKTSTGIIHKATDKYGAGEEPFNPHNPGKYVRDLEHVDKQQVKDLDASMGITWKNRGTKGVEVDEGNQKSEPPEADYGDDYQDMVTRVKKLAGMGPLKTVYDPAKRVYKNVPTAVQPKKEQR